MERSITTIGTAAVATTPDAMRISVGVVGNGDTVAQALAACASGVTAATEVSRRHTEARDIGSTGLNVWPRHDDDGKARGYQARHSLTIRCADLDAAGRLVMELGEIGDRVLVEGFELVISDPAPLERQAREAAYADARAKAEELAAYAGARLGEALAISEGGASSPGPVGRKMAFLSSDSMPFEAGTQSVTASLSVIWAISDLD